MLKLLAGIRTMPQCRPESGNKERLQACVTADLLGQTLDLVELLQVHHLIACAVLL